MLLQQQGWPSAWPLSAFDHGFCCLAQHRQSRKNSAGSQLPPLLESGLIVDVLAGIEELVVAASVYRMIRRKLPSGPIAT